jgi:hypothetical protein
MDGDILDNGDDKSEEMVIRVCARKPCRLSAVILNLHIKETDGHRRTHDWPTASRGKLKAETTPLNDNNWSHPVTQGHTQRSFAHTTHCEHRGQVARARGRRSRVQCQLASPRKLRS